MHKAQPESNNLAIWYKAIALYQDHQFNKQVIGTLTVKYFQHMHTHPLNNNVTSSNWEWHYLAIYPHSQTHTLTQAIPHTAEVNELAY